MDKNYTELDPVYFQPRSIWPSIGSAMLALSIVGGVCWAILKLTGL